MTGSVPVTFPEPLTLTDTGPELSQSSEAQSSFHRQVGMDVRNALGSLLPTNLRKKDPIERAIKSGNTTDRDANGQMPHQEKDQHPPMSEDQLQKAIEHLRSHAVVTEHNLTVELVQIQGKNFVLIKEPDGKILRRIPEAELWSLKDVQENEKGQLLRRTA